MTRMTGPDCVVMCNLINTYIHTYIHTYIYKYIHTYIHLCPREKTYQGTAASVAAHQCEAHPGEGNSFLEKLGRLLQKTRRSNRHGVRYKCGDLHANLSRHSSGCDRTPSDTMPPHSDGLGGEPSARNPDTPSTPAAETFDQSE